MKRITVLIAAVGSALGLVACAGGTDPATHIRATQAQLNGHGHTNDGPAFWWWEYSTSKSTVEAGNAPEVCGSPAEPGRCGPAQSPNANDIPLKVVVEGLYKNTIYYFRACGQDTNDPQQSCGKILSFKTTPGDSEAVVVDIGGASHSKWLIVRDGAGTFNRFFVSRGVEDGVDRYRIEDRTYGVTPGSSIVPGVGCVLGDPTQTYDNVVECPVAGISLFTVDSGALKDVIDFQGDSGAASVYRELAGGSGDDDLYGSPGPDHLTGKSGVDYFRSFGGSDFINARDNDTDRVFDCGESPGDTDTVTADTIDSINADPFNCEVVKKP